MSNQAKQQYIAVADNVPGEMSVYHLSDKGSAMAEIETYKKQRDIICTIYSSSDMDAAVDYAKSLYPDHHYMKDFLSIMLGQSSQ